jgi:hypothetical protein
MAASGDAAEASTNGKISPADNAADGRQSRDCSTPYDDVIDAAASLDDRPLHCHPSPYKRFSRLTEVGLKSLRRSSTPSPTRISPIVVSHRQTESDVECNATTRAIYRHSSSSSLPSRPLIDPSPTPAAIFRAASVTSPVDCPPPQLPPDLVRHLREQQALRLAAVSRALQHQLRYLHQSGSGGTAGGGSTTSGPAAASAAAVAAAALYYRHHHHPHHQQQQQQPQQSSFDPSACSTTYASGLTSGGAGTRLQLGPSATSTPALHGLIDPGNGGLHPCDPLRQLPVSHHHQQQQHRSMAAAAGFIADLQALHAATTGRAISPADSDNSIENNSGWYRFTSSDKDIGQCTATTINFIQLCHQHTP